MLKRPLLQACNHSSTKYNRKQSVPSVLPGGLLKVGSLFFVSVSVTGFVHTSKFSFPRSGESPCRGGGATNPRGRVTASFVEDEGLEVLIPIFIAPHVLIFLCGRLVCI